MTRSLLRKLIIAWWFLLVLSLVVMWATEGSLPPELAAYLARTDAELTPIESVGSVLGGLLALAALIASIGLFFVKPWARGTFLLTNIGAAFVPLIFFEPAVASVWTETIGYLHMLLTGGLLFSLYLPPLKQIIDKTSTDGVPTE